MPHAIVIANGEVKDLAQIRAALRPEDCTVAADGGLRYWQALGLLPQVVIGDLDSAEADWAALQARGVRLQRHPARKDETDLELALHWLKAAGITEALIFGALGGRWDQTLANLLLLAQPAWHGMRLRLVDGAQQLYLASPRADIQGQAGDTVSLIPLGGDAHGVTTTGLEYPLTQGTLPFAHTLGISNVLLGPTATVEVQSGCVLCVVIAQAPSSNMLLNPKG